MNYNYYGGSGVPDSEILWAADAQRRDQQEAVGEQQPLSQTLSDGALPQTLDAGSSQDNSGILVLIGLAALAYFAFRN